MRRSEGRLTRLRTVKQMQAGWAARGIDHAAGEAEGNRSRTDFAGARRRKAERLTEQGGAQ